jgi:hypothetical protein
VENAIGAVELWLDVFYANPQLRMPPYLHALLEQDASDILRNQLRQKGDRLCPRDAVELLRAVASYAAQQGITDRPISGAEFKEALKRLAEKPPRRRRLLYWLWRAFVAIVVLLAVIYSLPYTPVWRALEQWLPGLALAANSVIARLKEVFEWLKEAKDSIEVILLSVIILAAAFFLAWCMRRSHRAGEPPAIRRCLRYAWQYVRRYLPGGG